MSKENDETLDFYKTKQLAYTLFILSERAFNEKAYKKNHEIQPPPLSVLYNLTEAIRNLILSDKSSK
jgi:hypothetical protein